MLDRVGKIEDRIDKFSPEFMAKNCQISRFIAQYGKCAITGVELSFNDWHCHHKTPYYLSQDDSYGNLIIVHESIHRLIHLIDPEKIKVFMEVLNLNKKQLKKVNELREQCLNATI